MEEASGAEKRQFARVGAELVVRIKLGDSKVDYPAVFTRDVSSGGLGLEIGAKWPDSFEKLMSWSGPVDLVFELPPDHTVHARAAVVWGHVQEEEKEEEKGGRRRFRIGLRFVEIGHDDKSALLDFVRSKMVESMLEDDSSGRGGRPPVDGLP